MRSSVDNIAFRCIEFLVGVFTRAELELCNTVLVGVALCDDLAVGVLDTEAGFGKKLACGYIRLGNFKLTCGGLVDKTNARLVFDGNLVAVLSDLKVVVGASGMVVSSVASVGSVTSSSLTDAKISPVL